MNERGLGYEEALTDISEWMYVYIDETPMTAEEKIGLLKMYHHYQLTHLYERRKLEEDPT